jgi:GDP-4-dehydro-6-deoxy-D-mannose reductase
MATVLITGANGFVAKYLKREFSLRDKVILTDVKSGQGIVSLDITKKNQVEKIIKDYCPDEIYHLAAIASPRIEDSSLVKKVNVTGTLNVLEAVRKFCPKTKVLLVSSGYVYGNCLVPAKETSPVHPEGSYAKSKLEMEREALKKFPDLNIYIARSFTHSGKGQGPGYFFPDMAKKIKAAKKDESPEVEVYNPQNKRDFSHVQDVVRAYRLILEKGVPREIYNVCSGKTYRVLDVFNDMAKKAGLKDFAVKKIKHGIVLDLKGDNKKLKELGFKPKHEVLKIIDDVIK